MSHSEINAHSRSEEVERDELKRRIRILRTLYASQPTSFPLPNMVVCEANDDVCGDTRVSAYGYGLTHVSCGAYMAARKRFRSESPPQTVTAAAHAIPFPTVTPPLSQRARKSQRLEQRARTWGVHATSIADSDNNHCSKYYIGRSSDHVIILSSLPSLCNEADLRAFGERFGIVDDVRLVMAGRRAQRKAHRRFLRVKGATVFTQTKDKSETVDAVPPVHAGYGFVAFVRAQEVTTVMQQYQRVRDGVASPAQMGQFRIRKQLVVCDIERGRSGRMTCEQYASFRTHLRPMQLSFADFFPPSVGVLGGHSAERASRERLTCRRKALLEEVAINRLVVEGKAPLPPFVPRSLRSVAHLCPSRRNYREHFLHPRRNTDRASQSKQSK